MPGDYIALYEKSATVYSVLAGSLGPPLFDSQTIRVCRRGTFDQVGKLTDHSYVEVVGVGAASGETLETSGSNLDNEYTAKISRTR